MGREVPDGLAWREINRPKSIHRNRIFPKTARIRTKFVNERHILDMITKGASKILW